MEEFNLITFLPDKWAMLSVMLAPAFFSAFLLFYSIVPSLHPETVNRIVIGTIIFSIIFVVVGYNYVESQITFPRLLEIIKMYGRQNLVLVSTFITMLFVWYLFFKAYLAPKLAGPLVFDSEAWKKGREFERWRMAGSLITTKKLKGKNQKEVAELLGKPDQEPSKAFIYHLAGYENLRVFFSDTGKVTDVVWD